VETQTVNYRKPLALTKKGGLDWPNDPDSAVPTVVLPIIKLENVQLTEFLHCCI